MVNADGGRCQTRIIDGTAQPTEFEVVSVADLHKRAQFRDPELQTADPLIFERGLRGGSRRTCRGTEQAFRPCCNVCFLVRLPSSSRLGRPTGRLRVATPRGHLGAQRRWEGSTGHEYRMIMTT